PAQAVRTSAMAKSRTPAIKRRRRDAKTSGGSASSGWSSAASLTRRAVGTAVAGDGSPSGVMRFLSWRHLSLASAYNTSQSWQKRAGQRGRRLLHTPGQDRSAAPVGVVTDSPRREIITIKTTYWPDRTGRRPEHQTPWQ